MFVLFFYEGGNTTRNHYVLIPVLPMYFLFRNVLSRLLRLNVRFELVLKPHSLNESTIAFIVSPSAYLVIASWKYNTAGIALDDE